MKTKPIEFKGSTETLPSPAALYGETGSLPIVRLESAGHVPLVMSCWRLSLRDRLRALWTGRIWLGVLSDNPPPVSISTESPFADE
jgi:hypothetical protein